MEQGSLKRLYVHKKEAYAVEAHRLLEDLSAFYNIQSIDEIKVLNRYDVANVSDEQWELGIWSVFAEKPLDQIAREHYDFAAFDYILAIEALPGQYEQRDDSAEQALAILTGGIKPRVRSAKVYCFTGSLSAEDKIKIHDYLINPVEMREAKLEKPSSLDETVEAPEKVAILDGFIDLDDTGLGLFKEDYGLAMSVEDLQLTRSYFKSLMRNPSMTEIRVLDTYWSDHCRHTTFNTTLEEIGFEETLNKDSKAFMDHLENSLNSYRKLREEIHGDRLSEKPETLMDLATIGMKALRKEGFLDDLDASEEINACSIKVSVPLEEGVEDYLIMFKNETHNHPTEIEPFGGAATCLGGAIRDPLSGRSYVYQAMRVTGSGDPTVAVEDTLPGKLPQRKITTTAAAGYSSYGNQIGLATGHVKELYHEGYLAKRMEVGAVVASSPASEVIRHVPSAGDLVILLGGRTGRDGVGGATGSSKKHDESSLEKSGSQVQKGNPLTERNLQRFFRNPEASRMILRCNDFGAGGVAVAIGELADGVKIDLDRVLKKYEGLDGTEIAISESQERMACVIRKEDKDRFIYLAAKENLEATEVASITLEPKMVMLWQGDVIVDLDRSFLDLNGAVQTAKAKLNLVDFETRGDKDKSLELSFTKRLEDRLKQLEFASQKGLVERFDATVGRNTVLFPQGGRRQLTPEEGMAARIPVTTGKTDLATVMAFGFDPKLSAWSPYHGAYYAVLESISKLVAMGVSPAKIRLSFQEYFPTTSSPEKWGLPLAALLGGLDAQLDFKAPSIGGKDSMSGTFEDLDVPSTLISFAIGTSLSSDIHSATLFHEGRDLYYIPVPKNELGLVDAKLWNTVLRSVHRLMQDAYIGAAASGKRQGIAATVTQMCFGEDLGFSFDSNLTVDECFEPAIASLILEVIPGKDEDKTIAKLESIGAIRLGRTSSVPIFTWQDESIESAVLLAAWESPLESVFKTTSGVKLKEEWLPNLAYDKRNEAKPKVILDKPKVLIPVFPGTNCDYDSEAAWREAGANVEFLTFRNQTAEDLNQSLAELELAIDDCNILMLAGGFSAGDEPDGSAKFIATIFRNNKIKRAVERLMDERDGLILGICNGFQALIKLGLLPYGKISDLTDDSPSLTYNALGRHQAIFVDTRISSVKSPWLKYSDVGDVHRLPISHGEGRLIANEATLEHLMEHGQIVAQYVDPKALVTMEEPYNPNGSTWAIEALSSEDGRILGKMAHSERVDDGLYINMPGDKEQELFKAAVAYFTKEG